MKELQLDTWEQFEEKVSELAELNKTSLLEVLFRGQGNSKWRLVTTLERSARPEDLRSLQYYALIAKIRPILGTLTGKEWELPDQKALDQLFGDYDVGSRTMSFGQTPGYSYMAYLRHYGFPSPLLDWTLSPYVAAFFAFQQKPPGDVKDVAIFGLLESPKNMKGRSSSEPAVYRLGPLVQTDKRHFNQQSSYTMCCAFKLGEGWRFAPHEDVFENVDVDSWSTGQDQLWKFTLPATERQKVLRRLQQFNVNSFSLVGTEESLLEMLAIQELEMPKR